MIDPKRACLPIIRQCTLLQLNRSGVYYRPVPQSEANLELMRLIDAQFLETPYYGSRQMTWHLRRQGHEVGRKRVRRLMAIMGLRALYQKPRTTVPHPEHRKYPYLLRDLVIDRPNQVWCSDITYSAPRPGWSGGAYDWNAKEKGGTEVLPCSLLWGNMSPSGGDLLSTGRVT
ncbi:hypothetical protein AAJCM20276_33740 [Acetobacter aceti]|uniref:HTH-like domain-containing protein n=1 Tax=Acetobacter aceti TaxID=435 RepID=A0A6S6PNU5_ACEAC|nr:hypothetical protein AAJCM20276_33740 [Acetobacter aceti]